MGPMEKEEILGTVSEEEVRFVQLQFMDILGIAKTVIIPTAQLEKALDDGVLFDGSSIVGYATIEESDMRLRPDPDTFKILPWTSGELKTAGIMCDVYTANGDRFTGDPRFVLQRIMEEARQMGYVYNTGPEYEFFLFKTGDGGSPTVRISDTGGYFDLLPMDQGDAVRKETTQYFDALGYGVEASHHEVAPGQHEIDLRYSEAISNADRVMILKNAVKTVALGHGLWATFMPKPLRGENGSGMHTHQSLITPDGVNVFDDPDGEWGLSETCMQYIGGILRHARANCAILASWVNSYKRLVPGFEAPVYISWANMNRSALVRVPAGRGMSARVEVRNPDPAGNPYLQYAVMLAAGLHGIKEKLEPPEPVEVDLYKLTSSEREKLGIGVLPGSLGEALDELEASELMRETLGGHVFTHFLYVKHQEWDEYRTQVTEWELERYLSLL